MSLEKALITDTVTGLRIPVLFNPEEYTVTRENNFAQASIPGLSAPIVQFVNGNMQSLDMELFLDTYEEHREGSRVLNSAREDVRKLVQKLTDLMNINPATHAPPVLIFTWASLTFTCVLAKVTQSDVCFACHKTQRAQIHYLSTHPILVGKTSCSDCHNPHGSTAPKMLVKDTVNETCYTCHAEKRGPFLWEHSPVVDDCTNCHTPHGSTKPPLLKARVPFLCQECHSGDHGQAVNSGANLPNGNATTVNGQQPLANQSPRAQTNAKACLNCHVLVHGSNHPAGAKYQR